MKKISKSNSFSVLIPDGESIFALKVLSCLGKKPGFKVYILSNDQYAKTRYSRYCHKFITHNATNDSDLLKAIVNTLRATHADVILPVDVAAIKLISSNRDIIGKLTNIVPVPPTNDIEIADDKWLTAKWLVSNKIEGPKTILYAPGNEFEERLRHLSFPVLIKPRKGSGGEGIKIFEDRNALINFCQKNSKASEIIVQSYINGFDIDCSILCKEGKILAFTIQKRIVYDQKPVRGEHAVDFLYDEKTYLVVQELAEKLKWSGIVHIDLRYDNLDNGVKVLELNPRFWSSVCYSVLAGVNFPYLTCIFALYQDCPRTEISSKRLIQFRSALKIIIQRILGKKREDLYFDHIFPENIPLNDPLPYLPIKYLRLFNKLNLK